MAKKSATPKVSIDDLVNGALRTVAEATGSLRLVGKAKEGEAPALFPGATGANKDAIAALTATDTPLISVSGSGKSQEVTGLTAAGFARVAGSLPEEKVGAVMKAIAGALGAEEQVAFIEENLPKFPVAAPEVEPLLAEAVHRQTAEREAKVITEKARAERRAASEAALRRCADHLAALHAGVVKELQERLLAVGGSVPKTPDAPTAGTPAHTADHTRPPLTPVTEEDRDFRKDVAERLVSAWREAAKHNKDDARKHLEMAMNNISGLRRIGKVGEQVGYDGSLHAHIPGVFTDHEVKVAQSGWALEDGDDGEYVIEKAHVTK